METEFIYWRHNTPVGVRVEEVSGAEDKSGAVWRELAKQIYCENGRDGFREIYHSPIGAPLLEGEHMRISMTHTGHLLAVATLPKTPEADLEKFSPRTAMGIDAEKRDREQVLKVRERYLAEDELAMIPADDLTKNIIAWTAKEALYKAALTEGLDFRTDIIITKLPELVPDLDPKRAPACLGAAKVFLPDERGEIDANGGNCKNDENGAKKPFDFELYSYESEDYIVTIAISPKASKFSTTKR